MDIKILKELLTELKIKGELPYLEVKDSMRDKEYIGKVLSGLSNSASFHDQEYGYLIWGIKDKTWDIVGTKVNIETESQGSKGFIYPQIIEAFNYTPEILPKEFYLDGKRIYVLRIKNCENRQLCFKKIPYFRAGEVIDELQDHPIAMKKIINKNIDWSGQTSEGSNIDWIDPDAFSLLKEKYFEISENKNKKLTDTQLLNSLSLLDSHGNPNNTCLLFIGKTEIVKNFLNDRNKITWIYKDELNNIEERLSVSQENVPFIFSIQSILDKINKFNTTLQDIDLFRKDTTQYDKKAIEEMLVNSIAHRDWNANFWIEIVQTPSSLEIRNPGKFRADLDKVLFENKRPEYLNPTLADFLKKVHLMEKEGGGLKKAYTAQIKKGLKILLRYENEEVNPRVDFILSGKVSDVAFARFMFAAKLTQDQVVILDKINSGRNILKKDISEAEYALVQNLVTRTGQGGIFLKIKEHLLKKSKKYISSFSSTHASVGTSREIILDYARQNLTFTTAEIYDVMNGKTKPWVRKTLMQMTEENYLERISRGVYRLAKK